MKGETQTLERALGDPDLPETDREKLRALLEPVDLGSWFKTIDDSPYALGDWLRALLAFDEWLAERNLVDRPVHSMLGYLECCTMTTAETLAPPDFAALARANLDRHGFDAARPAQP